MYKFLNIIKSLLTVLLIILNILYIRIFGLSHMIYVIYLILLAIFSSLFLKDLFRHNKINHNIIYNILCIFLLLIMNFVFIVTIYDQGFLYNSEYYKDLIKIYSNMSLSIIENSKTLNMYYLFQNSLYFCIGLGLIFVYRMLNVEKQSSHYNLVSIICCIISIGTLIPTISFIGDLDANIIWFTVLNICLLVTEIYRLIKDNHKKYEWPIYLSFLFNMFAFIAIFIHLYYH